MLRYIAKRMLQLIPTLILVSVIVFLMVRFIPGDPITLLYGVSESGGTSEEYLESMREMYGLNDPLIVQYFRWILGFFKGDMGTSLLTHKTVLQELTNRYQYTLSLIHILITASLPSALARSMSAEWVAMITLSGQVSSNR